MLPNGDGGSLTSLVIAASGLVVWIVGVIAMLYFPRWRKRRIARQERFVNELREAYGRHPFPDYAERLRVEQLRLERMKDPL